MGISNNQQWEIATMVEEKTVEQIKRIPNGRDRVRVKTQNVVQRGARQIVQELRYCLAHGCP